MKRLKIPAGATGELGYIRDLLVREPLAGSSKVSTEFLEAAFADAIELLARIATLRTYDETVGGKHADEAERELEDAILRARQIVGDPGYPEFDAEGRALDLGGITVHVRPDMPAGSIVAVVDGKVVGGVVNVK